MYFDIDSITLQCRCCWQWSDPNSCLTTNLRPSPSLDSTTVLWLAVWLCSATTVPHHSELNYWKEDSSLIQKNPVKIVYTPLRLTELLWKFAENRLDCNDICHSTHWDELQQPVALVVNSHNCLYSQIILINSKKDHGGLTIQMNISLVVKYLVVEFN